MVLEIAGDQLQIFRVPYNFLLRWHLGIILDPLTLFQRQWPGRRVGCYSDQLFRLPDRRALCSVESQNY